MRYPAVAGRFYPSDKDALLKLIGSCFEDPIGPGALGPQGDDRHIVAALAPHAGISVSGSNAANTFAAIRRDGLPEAYVVIGPDHYGQPYEAVTCSDSFLMPSGEVGTDERIVAKLRQYIPDDVRAHSREHSIEVMLPFLQHIDPNPHIVPVIMGRQDLDMAGFLAKVLAEACSGRDVIFLASSDLSHYVPKDVAFSQNMEVLDRIAALDMPGMYRTIAENKVTVCGYGPIATAVMASSPSEARILRYSDSWDSIRYDRDSVVGYGSVVMYR